MRNLTHRWTQSRHFFPQNQGTFYRFSPTPPTSYLRPWCNQTYQFLLRTKNDKEIHITLFLKIFLFESFKDVLFDSLNIVMKKCQITLYPSIKFPQHLVSKDMLNQWMKNVKLISKCKFHTGIIDKTSGFLKKM